jgi:hypothetical protein
MCPGTFLFSCYTTLNRLRTRHVKCDESKPVCQRCTSTGRTCDGYSGGSTPNSTPSGILAVNPMTSSPRSTSKLEDVLERRSFDFFRTETVPSLAGCFGSPAWNVMQIILQACNREPAVSQAVVALGALHERASMSLDSLQTTTPGVSKPIETTFPLRQHSKALVELRRYLSMPKDFNLDIILICALIHISIEIIQKNYANALVHLENSLMLLQQSSKVASVKGESSQSSLLNASEVDSDITRAFLRMDLQASTYQGMRAPAIAGNQSSHVVPGRFQSISQAKDILDILTGQLCTLRRNIIEEYRYRKNEDIPLDAVAQAARIKCSLDLWNERFEKYLNCPTSKFSRQEQLLINVVLINHRQNAIEVASCAHSDETIFDQFDSEFDEIVTMATSIVRARNTSSSDILKFSLDTGVIHPLYWTAVKCRDIWIRQRAMSLLRSITFQEGVWNAAAQTRIAEVAIAMEQQYNSSDILLPDQRPPEFVRVHSIGSDFLDPVNRVANVHYSQKLDGLDGPWYDYVELVSW